MDERWFLGSVGHNPEIATKLGQFLAEFATMEGMLPILLSITIDRTPHNPLAGAILGHVQSVSTRCDIVKSCANSSLLPEIDKEAVRSFVSLIATINAKRNKYVHAVYETNIDTKEVRMTTWGFSLVALHRGYDGLVLGGSEGG